MTKIQKKALTYLSLFIGFISYSQSENKQIVKIAYTSTPISQYRMTDQDMKGTPTKASIYEFMQGITKYYSLYINLKDRSSVYKLDSTAQVRPRGWEDSRSSVTLLDTIFFTLKSPQKETFKHEWVMNQVFFTKGEVGDIEWKLINEEKIIDGLNCSKAVAKNYPMLTAWYTKEIPVSNGPSIFQGLPGLVVWAEDYSNTIQLLQIEYTGALDKFNELYGQKFNQFTQQKERKKHYNIEPILIIKKGDMHISSYEYFHEKPYRKQ
jgi:GLPGLI family protein